MQLYIKKTNKQSKNGQKTYIDLSPKKTYRQPRGTLKDAQYHYQRNADQNYQSEWPSSKNIQTINAREGIEKENLLALLVGM